MAVIQKVGTVGMVVTVPKKGQTAIFLIILKEYRCFSLLRLHVSERARSTLEARLRPASTSSRGPPSPQATRAQVRAYTLH
jgi:hypothetical protein